MNQAPTFPPLLWGERAHEDAFDLACMRAALGCEAGLVTYTVSASKVQAALVFAPEVPLRKAIAMLPLCGVGFQNALGSLAPPEVAVHLEWDGGIRVNGAACGRFRAKATDRNPDETPGWLVVGFFVPLIPEDDRPGDTPDRTSLFAEGCADVDPAELIEMWARHTLNWITKWEQSGARAVHENWRGLAHGIGEPIKCGTLEGTFLGVDEDFGMLIRDDTETHLIPLTTLLEDTA